MLFIFSGRRGVHCWVADNVARKLDNSGRAAVAEYLSIFSGSKAISIPDDFVHPMFEDAYNCIMETDEFDKLVLEQKLLDDSNLDNVLSFCKDENWKHVLRQDLTS